MIPAGLALAVALAVGAPDPAEPAARLAAANARLEAGDAEGAAAAYEALLAEGLESPALHVNLGAARLRAGRRGGAIASFERALRLDPRDGDARADLALARSRDLDRLAAAPGASLVARVAERTPDGWAAAALAAPWALLWLLVALRRRAAGRLRAVAGLAAVLAGLAAGAGGVLLAARAAERRARVAVVVAAEAPVRDGPEAALRPAFTLHEGTAVRVVEAREDALRVRLANGLEGWIAARDLEEL